MMLVTYRYWLRYNCVLKTGVIKWPLKLRMFFYVFFKIQKHDLLRFLSCFCKNSYSPMLISFFCNNLLTSAYDLCFGVFFSFSFSFFQHLRLSFVVFLLIKRYHHHTSPSCIWQCKEQCQVHEGEEGHAQPGWTISRRGQDSPWKSQSEWKRTGINGESTSMVWPTLGSRTAKEQNRTGHVTIELYPYLICASTAWVCTFIYQVIQTIYRYNKPESCKTCASHTATAY